MNKTTMKMILALCGSVGLLTLSMCCSMNKLQGREFREHTVSALMAHPHPPEIFTDSWTDVDYSNFVTAMIGIGTGIAKEVEVSKTRTKMDSAMGMVDIPEIIRIETLERGAQYLHYRPVEETGASDYLFDIILRHYGIEAKSWSASVYFKIDAKITLFDNMKGTDVWRSCFNERFPVSREMFGFSDAAGNIITAVSLSKLSAEQIAQGLENLAVHTSDKMIHKLHRDFSKKNQ